MNWLDVLILTVLIFFFLLGFSRGLINQVFSLAAVIVGIASGILFYDSVGRVLIEKEVIETMSSALVIGFILFTIGVFIIVQLFGWLASRLIGKLNLGWVNRLVGGLLGVVIGTVCIFLIISWLNISVESTFKKSKIFPHVKVGYDTVMDSIPHGLRAGYDQTRERFVKEGKKVITHIKESDEKSSGLENKEDWSITNE